MAPRRCKNGKVKSGARKGLCRKQKVSGAAKRKGPLRGAAARAVACKGRKGSEFRACLRTKGDSSKSTGTGMYLNGMRRRRKSRR
jgi:hypothetical protein